MTWKSTLNQPIPEHCAERIREAWAELCQKAIAIKILPDDPVRMINCAADIRMAAWEVTRAVDEAWFQANKAIQAPTQAPRETTIQSLTRQRNELLKELHDLGLVPKAPGD